MHTKRSDIAEPKLLLLILLYSTIVAALFDFRPDLNEWLKFITADFTITLMMVAAVYFLEPYFAIDKTTGRFRKFLKILLLFSIAGIAGGFAAWGMISWVNPPKIAHPALIFAISITLSVLLGGLIFSYLEMRKRYHNTELKLAEKEIREQKLLRLNSLAELEVLRAKLKPHFLFNSLNSIASLIPVYPVKAERLIERLSQLLRYSLKSTDRDMVPLSEELDLIKKYLDIEKTRLGDKLEYEINCDPETENLELPPLLLQPIVENSIKHGIAPMVKQGRITIRSCRRNGDCIIDINDTGRGFESGKTKTGFGITSVRERLELIYGGSASFEINSTNGVNVKLKIPVINSEGMKNADQHNDN